MKNSGGEAFILMLKFFVRIKVRKGGGGTMGGSQGELGEGPGVVDLQSCWGFSEQSFKGRIQDLGSSK